MSETTDDEPAFAWNYQQNGPFITDRTFHRVRSTRGRFVTSACGVEFQTEMREMTDDDSDVSDRHKCGRCW